MASAFLGLSGVNPSSEPGDIRPADAPSVAPSDTSSAAASIGVFTKKVPITVEISSPVESLPAATLSQGSSIAATGPSTTTLAAVSPSSTQNLPSTQNDTGHASGLNAAAGAGIGVGVTLFMVALLGLAFFLWLRYKKGRATASLSYTREKQP